MRLQCDLTQRGDQGEGYGVVAKIAAETAAYPKEPNSMRLAQGNRVCPEHGEMALYLCRGVQHHRCLPCQRAKAAAKRALVPRRVRRNLAGLSPEQVAEHKRNRTLAYAAKEQAMLRSEMLAAYGGRGACCGETQPEFLALDHVRNDGAAHRREIGTGRAVYRWLRKNNYPQDGRFQLLCHNCNMAKQFSKGCPHERNALLAAGGGR